MHTPELARAPRRAGATVALLALAFLPAVQAAGLYSSTQLVAGDGASAEQVFAPTAQQAGAVDVTVTDTAFPAALAALRVAVTQGATVLESAAATAGSPASVTLTFTASAGVAYTIRIVGRPDAAAGSGSALVAITKSGQPTVQYAAFPATFQAPLPVGAGTALNLSQTISIPTDGDYQATLTDLSLPAPMSYLSAALFQGASQVGPALQSGPPTTITGLAAGSYRLTIVGVPAAAGALFGLRIQGGPANALVYPAAGASGVTALGGVSAPIAFDNPATGVVALGVTDLMLPAALTSLGAVLTDADGTLVARQCLMACGAVDPPSGIAAAGGLQLWRFASAGAGGGSDLVTVSAGASTLYAGAESVAPPASGPASSWAFVFPFTAPATGSYAASVTDLVAPAPLAGVQFAVFQGSTLVGSSTGAGQITVQLAAGPAELRVVAQLASAAGLGLLGAQVSPGAAGSMPVLSTAQAVGASAGTRAVSVASAGVYAFTLTDGHWPAAFATLDLFVTQGAGVIGKIYGGGSVPLALAAGDYQITYAAVPDATEAAGLYGIDVQAVAPATVSLTASQSAVAAGQSVSLSWSSTGATSCAASGGWSGAQATSGSGVSVGPLNATTTFTIQCVGDGGTSPPSSVTVTVSAAATNGGGGTLDPAALGALALLMLLRQARKYQ